MANGYIFLLNISAKILFTLDFFFLAKIFTLEFADNTFTPILAGGLTLVWHYWRS